MLIRPATSHTLTQCWYTRIHQPGPKRWRDENGTLHAVCRHCEREVHSQGGKSWVLSDGIDLDALATSSSIRFICVTNVADGLVVARYPIERDASPRQVEDFLSEITARHEAGTDGKSLDVRLMGGPKG
ncbi:MAG: hypothetical protein ACOVKV_00010 [Novosphingobium sp.]